MTTERGQDIAFAKRQIRERARLPSGPGRALEMKRDRNGESGGEGWGVVTLNDWDRPGRALGKGQTEMLQEERQMENDRCALDDVGENHKRGGRVRE